jgi:hypothetical protein
MPCKFTYDENGKLISIACGPRVKPKVCHYCKRPSDKLCDFKLNSGRTCDLPICANCSTHPEHDTDYCKAHTEIPVFNVERGRWFDSKYRSICIHPNCRRRIHVGEKILWLGTEKVLCLDCAQDALNIPKTERLEFSEAS